MTAELIFIESYTCPRCGTELEVPRHFRSMWVLCPQCGRPNLPPAEARPIPRPRPSPDEEILYLGPLDGGPLPAVRTAQRSVSLWRIFILVGFIVSFCALASALFGQQTVLAAIFGFGTLVFLGLMTYPTKPRRP